MGPAPGKPVRTLEAGLSLCRGIDLQAVGQVAALTAQPARRACKLGRHLRLR